jgi:hypothetical protein
MRSGDKILALAIALVAVLSLLMRSHDTSGSVLAEIKVGTAVIEAIDLSAVTEPYTKTVYTGNDGYNVIEVREGMIRVVEANCPEQIDVRQGWISSPYESIVCLPHRLVITILPAGPQRRDVDGVSY